MPFAITPKGIGKCPGARAIADANEPLALGETFIVAHDAFNAELVLDEGGASLRPKSTQEQDAERKASNLQTMERGARQALMGKLLELEAASPTPIAEVAAWDAARKAP